MGSRYLFKLEYNHEKFCTFFVNLFEKNGYNFVDLTDDIKANVRSLQYVTPTTIRIRFRDDDGDYVNLTYGDQEMFNEMFETAHPVKDRDYKKIHLKVSQLDSPIQIPHTKDAAEETTEGEVVNHNTRRIPEPKEYGGNDEVYKPPSRPLMPAAQKSRTSCSLNSKFIDVADINEEEGSSPHPHHALSLAKPTFSPLERYVNKLNGDKSEQERKVAMLRDQLRIVDEKLLQAKSSHFAEGNVCGNCHLRLGHTSKKCALEKCSQVFDCGIEKFHPGQINRSKMMQEIQKEESKLQKLNVEVNNRQSSIQNLKKSLVSQVEQRLLSENESDYLVGGLQNWALLRRHVHLIESYCKRNFNGKIPPKQNLSQILQMAIVDEQRGNLSQPKRRRVHENPAKDVLQSHGIKFPSVSTLSSPPSTSSCPYPCSDILSRCEPKSKEEEDAQLDLALKASACDDDSVNTNENQKCYIKTESVYVDLTTESNLPEAASNTNIVASSVTEQDSSENNAAIALMSLFNTKDIE